jgi:peptidoglycan hydrolase-like protein with peptidoglycan-binding domain
MRGDGGPAVARLQLRLRVPADGVFGRLTERAVKAFQRSRRLTATGVVDRVTRSALGLPPFGRESVYRSSAPRSVRLPAPLVQIAMCESMGNPRAVSSDGRYRGKYQFSRETWRRLGGKGDPAEAPEWLQDWLALRLYRKRGSAPWPSCSGLPSSGRSPA